MITNRRIYIILGVIVDKMMNRRHFLKIAGLCGISLAVGLNKTVFPTESVNNLETKIQENNPLGLNPAYNYSDEDLERNNAWIDKTFQHSKKNKNYALIIDKASYTLNLIKDGKLHSNYPIELGFNPYDDKRTEGDGCTPEGFYEVVVKKDIGQTSFYRAFLINYPNKDDWKEFKQLKQNKIISAEASIGRDIEIHGDGSGKKGNKKGHNWTLGCIALSNQDIDKIFPFVINGTKVTIVKYSINSYKF